MEENASLVKSGYWTGMVAGILIFMLSACAATYQKVNPKDLDFPGSPLLLKEGQLEISVKPGVLQSSGNSRYAKKEKKNKRNLLAVLLTNHSGDTIFFPDNFQFVVGRDTLIPLNLEETLFSLCQSNLENQDRQDLDDMFEVEGEWVVDLVGFLVAFKRFKADKDFYEELEEFYLVPSFISPFQTVVGLLCLPVSPELPFEMVWRKKSGP